MRTILSLMLLGVGSFAVAEEPLPQGAKLRLGTAKLRLSRPGGSVELATGSLVPPNYDQLIEESATGGQQIIAVPSGEVVRTFGDHDDFNGIIAGVSNHADRVALIDYDKNLTIWDTNTDQKIDQFPCENVSQSKWLVVQLTADGKRAIYNIEKENGEGDKAESEFHVIVRDVDAARTVHEFDVVQKSCVGLALSRDNTTLATYNLPWNTRYKSANEKSPENPDQIVQIWDMAMGKERCRLRLGKTPETVALSNDGKSIACACNNRGITLYDTRTGEIQKQLPQRSQEPTVQLVFAPDNKQLAAMEYHGYVERWAFPSGQRLDTLAGLVERQLSKPHLAWCDSGQLILSGQLNKAYLQWDAIDGKPLHPVGHTDTIQGLRFSAEGKKLASTNAEDEVMYWDAESGKPLSSVAISATFYNAPQHRYPSPPIASFSADLKTVVCNRYSIDLTNGKTRFRIPDPAGIPTPPNDWETKVLATITPPRFASITTPPESNQDAEARIIVWDGTSGVEQTRFHFQMAADLSKRIRDAAISSDGNVLATVQYAEKDKRKGDEITFVDLRSKSKLSRIWIEYSHGYDAVNRAWIVFSSDGKTLVRFARGDKETIRIADGTLLDTKKILDWKEFTGNGLSMPPIDSADGSLYAIAPRPSSSRPATIQLRDATTDTLLKEFVGHSAPITAMAFSPDGKTLATGSEDTTILLWNLDADTPITP